MNAIVGTSSYTSGSCTYNLRLVSSNTTQVELQEEVTAGACEPDYAIVAVKDGKLTENVYVLSPRRPAGLHRDADENLTRAGCRTAPVSRTANRPCSSSCSGPGPER